MAGNEKGDNHFLDDLSPFCGLGGTIIELNTNKLLGKEKELPLSIQENTSVSAILGSQI